MASCASDGVFAYVHKERRPVTDASAPYERLWDRTDELASAACRAYARCTHFSYSPSSRRCGSYRSFSRSYAAIP